MLKPLPQLAALLLLLATSARAQTVTPVPHLDLARFTGTWYEIARLPIKSEKHCLSDVMVLFAPGDNPRRFQGVTSCLAKNNNPDARNTVGKSTKAADGRLTLGYIWPFTSKYWVLATDPAPDTQWTLVGSPNHKALWILSRTPTLAPAVLADIRSRATAQGFPTAKLLLVPQHPDPAATPPPILPSR